MTMGLPAAVSAYIALGSNLGERQRNIHAAILKLRQTEGIEVTRISSFLDNAAVGGPETEDAPRFLNAAAEVRTTLPALSLHKRMMQIEKELGRQRRRKWEPRPIDLDLLLYGDQIISMQELVVPHPLMHERKFVLHPLAEIAPDAVHPSLQMTIAGLLDDLMRKEFAKPPKPME